MRGPAPKKIKCEGCGRQMLFNTRSPRKTAKKYLPDHPVCSDECRRIVAARLGSLGLDTKRSKAEAYLESIIRREFPKEDLICNDRLALHSGLELDLHLRTSKIAVELNGPTHYRPLYGKKSLADTQRNDRDKARECGYRKIMLLVVNMDQCSKWEDSKEAIDLFYAQVLKPLLSK